ncbi:unnamed protein product [Heterobilharzia americana]|nr:unnamed protein product [Heterobilharzia americana]
MGKFINMKFMVFFVLSLLSVQNVKGGSGNNTVFDLVLFITEVWNNFCSRSAGTVSYLLKNLPKSLGGDGNQR